MTSSTTTTFTQSVGSTPCTTRAEDETDEGLEGAINWDDFDGAPVASLLPSSGCKRLRDVSHRRTWDDLTQEFLRQFAFNTVVDVSRRELEALR
ncbi:hypothetical protein CK203_019616 [Vitis vinifera]|uniref:Retrotransposon gag domain-containing protein n=1 Tax=Vitis vinifera TaxID=29760 RepID=A0A438JR20_VITVI|nr:hypothetical protein CK203_019616 [Vitis vinifera]